MLIKSIELQNFRSYKDRVVIPDLSNVNIFIGPNSAGKSNVIEALKYLRELIQANPKKPFTDNAFDRDPNAQVELALTFELSSKQRNRLIERLFEENKQVSSAEAKKSPFMKTWIYRVVIKNTGIVEEEFKTPNIVEGELPIMLRNKNSVNVGNLVKGCKEVTENQNIKKLFLRERNHHKIFMLLTLRIYLHLSRN